MNHGHIYEMLFWIEATKRGFIVSKPHGDSASYDFVVDWRGKLKRVQVKHYNGEPKNGKHYKITLKRIRKGEISQYKKEDCDYIAIHISDDWFIIPVEIPNSINICITPKGKSKYNQYKNRWDLLQ